MEVVKNSPLFYTFILLFCFFLPFVLLGVIYLFQRAFGGVAKNPYFFLLFGILSSILNFIGMLINETMILRVITANLSLYWLVWGIYFYKIKKLRKLNAYFIFAENVIKTTLMSGG